MATILNLVNYLILFLPLANGEILDFIESETYLKCQMDNRYWELVNWYFGRISFVGITTINRDAAEEELDLLLLKSIKNLFESGRAIKVEKLNSNFEERVLSYADTFDWQGNKFIPRTPEKYFRRKRNQGSQHKKPMLADRKGSVQGNLVLAKNIAVLSDFLTGTPRRPFNNPRIYYLLTLLEAETNWKQVVSVFMDKLWKLYGIANVILTAPCLNQTEENIGYYAPFQVTSGKGIDKYGVTKWTTMENIFHQTEIFNKFNNLNKFPLKVSMFRRYPTSMFFTEVIPLLQTSYYTIEARHSNGYSGFDGTILGNMAKLLNFTVITLDPKDHYGYRIKNGSFVGSIGDILYRKVTLTFNARFMKDYGTEEIEFLFPVYFDKMCIIAPKALKIPQWMAIFNCFSVQVWGVIVLVNCVCGCFWYLLKNIGIRHVEWKPPNKFRENRAGISDNKQISVACIEIWLVILSGISNYNPRQIFEKVFLCTCLLANIIIVGSFQGSLYTSFSTTTYYKDINTMEELDQSGLSIGTGSKSLADIFGNDTSVVIRSLKRKFNVLSGIPIITRTAENRDICCIERLADINIIIADRYMAPDGSVLLHAIPDCPRAYYLAYLTKTGWPLSPIFNSKIQQLFEGGFLNKWYNWFEDSMILHIRLHRLDIEEKLQAFNLIDMQIAFYCLGIGLFVCSVAFLFEIAMEHSLLLNSRLTVIQKFNARTTLAN